MIYYAMRVTQRLCRSQQPPASLRLRSHLHSGTSPSHDPQRPARTSLCMQHALHTSGLPYRPILATVQQYSEAILGLGREVIVRPDEFYTRPTTCFQALGCMSRVDVIAHTAPIFYFSAHTDSCLSFLPNSRPTFFFLGAFITSLNASSSPMPHEYDDGVALSHP